MILKMFYGFCMAMADSVPGVSGGTIAFILGFYEKLLDSLHYINSKDLIKRNESRNFLLKLFSGWILGMSLSVMILSKLFESNIYFLSSVFLGLTLASIPFVILAEKSDIKGKYINIIFTFLGIFIVVGISILRNYVSTDSSINFATLSILQYLYVFLSGMVAITAMILPGISGSTLLLIFGVYVPTISAIKQFLTLNFNVVPGLMALGFGILSGLALSIGTIRKMLKTKKSQTLYFIIGLMIGSLYAIAMGPTTLDIPQASLTFSNFKIVGFIIGIFILLFLEFTRRKLEKHI